jgi:branched-chain amino acid aminotransferase
MSVVEMTAGARLPHDERYEAGAAYVNGAYCPLGEASVPILDMGFLQADATYEKATVARGRFFRLDDHYDRFERSCAKFRLRNPLTREGMTETFSELLRLTGLTEAGVFWVVTRGMAREASDRNNPDVFENRFYAFASEYTSIATPEQRRTGLDVIVSERYIRTPPKAVDPTAKNFNWQDMKLSLFEAREREADWSVLTDADGFLTEAAGANVFVVEDGELYTPDSGCLEGITRLAAIDLAELIGVPTHLEKVHADRLRTAEDAFLTSTAGGIMPINSVDGALLGGNEGPGKLAHRLDELYWEKLFGGWKSTPVDYEGGPR